MSCVITILFVNLLPQIALFYLFVYTLITYFDLNMIGRMHKMTEKYVRTVRTDLAIEARDMYVKEPIQKNRETNIGIRSEERDVNGITISYVDISEEGAKAIQKKAGSYITIYADGVKKQDT